MKLAIVNTNGTAQQHRNGQDNTIGTIRITPSKRLRQNYRNETVDVGTTPSERNGREGEPLDRSETPSGTPSESLGTPLERWGTQLKWPGQTASEGQDSGIGLVGTLS